MGGGSWWMLELIVIVPVGQTRTSSGNKLGGNGNSLGRST